MPMPRRTAASRMPGDTEGLTCAEVIEEGLPHNKVGDCLPQHLGREPKQLVCMLYKWLELAGLQDCQ